jgi:hypothetical protein
MSDPGFAAWIVHRTGVHVGMERNHGRLMPLKNDEVHSIREREFSDALFKILE